MRKKLRAQKISDNKAEFEAAHKIAKELFDKMDADLIKQHAKKLGIKLSELKEILRDFRDIKPRKAPKVFEMFIVKDATHIIK
ncbi:hypothetical protein [Candidatus Symbiopectobacterium sp. NZEC135]|uniref:hypothetical protein n=1 Tax=Candidatus Symbiopectobacterium sp. NZEC135 TaxID=2820471 RepID=UPI00222608E6|nr:hypothetical protein [Candidatus Symbiopectobacterium sp. NZEC135]MCW2477716.1 hypothetical protein [Candidatus Symbiopectobacterium sp. NZEC135]